MSQQPVNHGTTAGDGQGESLFNAFSKVNANDAELFGAKTEFVANYAALPAVGEIGKIYVTLDDDAMYRWTGTAYDDLGGIQFVANAAMLPAVGEALKVYVARDTFVGYVWDGAAYQPMSSPLSRNEHGVVTGVFDGKTGKTVSFVSDAQKWIKHADFGTQITDISNAVIVANGTPSSGAAGVVTTDIPPVRGGYAVRLIGDAAIRASMTSQFSGVQATGPAFKGIAVWAKAKGRAAGPVMAQVFVGNGADPYVGKAIACTCAIPSDGKWHLLFIPRTNLAAQNAFVYGTDTITSIGIRDRNDSANLGYPGMLTNAEELQIGPVYINPFSRPKFLIRFDDSLSDCIIPNGTFLADGITQAWSGYSLLSQYGFGSKGSIFHLTRRLNTSNSLRTFLTTAQLAQLASYGWSHCTQTHQDPVDGSNNGLRLMGMTGYASKSIASIDAASNTLVTSVAHNIINGYWGYPIILSGTDLPAPLVAGTVYWARQVTNVNTMQLHPTETDSIANTNVIDLTSAGVAANFTYRYGYSANDSSLQQGDITNAINTLTALGYGGTAKIWAPNQGALDKGAIEAARSLGIEMILGINSSGTGYAYPRTRHPHMETTGEFSGGTVNTAVLDTLFTVPSAIQTDGAPTAADVRAYIDGVISAGGVGQNYHHTISAANGPVLAAYLEHLRLRVSEGACDVVTAAELRDYIEAARYLTAGVVH